MGIYLSIVAVNDYALHSIEEAKERTALAILWPFEPSKERKEVITQTFLQAMDVQATQLSRLVLEAENSLASLDRLELVLATLHELQIYPCNRMLYRSFCASKATYPYVRTYRATETHSRWVDVDEDAAEIFQKSLIDNRLGCPLWHPEPYPMIIS